MTSTGLSEESGQAQQYVSSSVTIADDEQAPTTALEEYHQALDSLDHEIGQPGLASALSTALQARDKVAHIMATDQALASQWLHELLPLDERLKDKAAVIVEKISSDTFTQWRESLLVPPTAWWWYLDQKVDAVEQVRHATLLLLAGLFITFSLTVAIDISTRFLSGGPDAWGVISTAAQAFLTFLTGTAFAGAGRQWLHNLYTRAHLARKVQSISSFLLALGVMLAIVGFRQGLPRISEKYYDVGLALRKENKVSEAMESYRRAISLDPDNRLAHFGLGNAYKSVLDYDKAIAEYQKVIEIDSSHAGANNQLMLCYLQKGNDYERALEIISRIFPVEGKDADTRYAAYKNRAWALWGMKRYELAKADLQRALDAVRESKPPRQGAEAHAILAQVLEDQSKILKDLKQIQEASKLMSEAFSHWQIAAHPAEGDFISTKWLSLAVLHQAEGQKP